MRRKCTGGLYYENGPLNINKSAAAWAWQPLRRWSSSSRRCHNVKDETLKHHPRRHRRRRKITHQQQQSNSKHLTSWSQAWNCWRQKKFRQMRLSLAGVPTCGEGKIVHENCNQLQNRRPNNDAASKQGCTRQKTTSEQTSEWLQRRGGGGRVGGVDILWRRINWHFVTFVHTHTSARMRCTYVYVCEFLALVFLFLLPQPLSLHQPRMRVLFKPFFYVKCCFAQSRSLAFQSTKRNETKSRALAGAVTGGLLHIAWRCAVK